jgi:hypothetical protein
MASAARHTTQEARVSIVARADAVGAANEDTVIGIGC